MKLQKQFVRKNEYNKVKGPSKKAVSASLEGQFLCNILGDKLFFNRLFPYISKTCNNIVIIWRLVLPAFGSLKPARKANNSELS